MSERVKRAENLSGLIGALAVGLDAYHELVELVGPSAAESIKVQLEREPVVEDEPEEDDDNNGGGHQ